jgi:hypothetical protein
LERRVSKEKASGAARLKWPFTEKENEEFIAQIQRNKTDLIMVPNIEQMQFLF